MKKLFDAACYIGRWPSSATPACPDIKSLLAKMDELGIEKALVNHTLAWQYSPAFGNTRLMEQLASHPRLEACWGVTPGLAMELYGNINGFERELAKYNIRAVRIYPRDHVISLDEWMVGQLFEMLNRRRMVVLMDIDQVFLQTGMYDYDANGLDRVRRICKIYPDISLILTRVGYRAYQSLLQLLSDCSNLYLDLSYLGTHLALEDITHRFGPGRVVFGTSYPFVEPSGPLARLQFSGLTEDQKDAVGWGNLERLLNRAGNTLDLESNREPIHPKLKIPGVEVTDAHCHLGQYFKFAIPNPGPEGMISVMDAAGVKRACISSHLAISGDWKVGNELTLEAVRKYPNRFIGHVVVSPNEPGLIREEVARYMDQYSFKAIKVVPDTHQQAITSKGYEPMWEIAAERKCLVLSHTFHGSSMDDPRLFAEIARRYPTVPVLIVHSGALTAGFENAIRIAKEWPNLYLDLSGSNITSPWIKRMVDELGAEKVVYSSDIPFIDLRYCFGRVLYAGLTQDQLELVMGGNIRRILGLKPVKN